MLRHHLEIFRIYQNNELVFRRWDLSRIRLFCLSKWLPKFINGIVMEPLSMVCPVEYVRELVQMQMN